MKLLSQGTKEKEFDVRVVERNLSKGLVAQSVVDEHLKGLPDDSDNATYADISELLEPIAGKSSLRSS